MARRRNRRVVKRAMTRAKATEVRRRIENAQNLVLGQHHSVFTDSKYRQAKDLLDRYGVTAYENITQSRRRILRYWRVYAER